MVSKRTAAAGVLIVILAASLAPLRASAEQAGTGQPASAAQSADHGPANSKAETIALGYLRTLLVAQRQYKKKKGGYATSLNALVGHGSFTRRMANRERGDYLVEFRSNGKDFSVSMAPRQFDAEHRAFYMDESGVIRAEQDKLATAASPPLPKAR